jgi:hypothetical protein
MNCPYKLPEESAPLVIYLVRMSFSTDLIDIYVKLTVAIIQFNLHCNEHN